MTFSFSTEFGFDVIINFFLSFKMNNKSMNRKRFNENTHL